LSFVFFSNTGLSFRRIAAFVKMTLLICGFCHPALADEALEYKIKAAYLYNFTKFISWPERNTATFNICLIGHNAFGNLLNALENKAALDKPIRIHRFDSAKQAKDCHIVYFETIDSRENLSIPGVLTIATLEKTLTVSSQPFFAEQGGMIGFVLEEDKVKLHINLKALKQSGLGISAKLIEVSTLIEGAGNE